MSVCENVQLWKGRKVSLGGLSDPFLGVENKIKKVEKEKGGFDAQANYMEKYRAGCLRAHKRRRYVTVLCSF